MSAPALMPGQSAAGVRLTRRNVGVIVVCFVALNLMWRAVRYGVNPPLWGDETMVAINLHSRGFGEFLRPLMYSQLAPPGFMWLSESVTRVLGFSGWALRLWPAIAGTAAVVLFTVFALRHLRRREAVLAAVIFAASYYPLRHSVELKPYSTDLLASAAVLLLNSRDRAGGDALEVGGPHLRRHRRRVDELPRGPRRRRRRHLARRPFPAPA